MRFQTLCSSPVPPWSQEFSLIGILGRMVLGLLVSGTAGGTLFWLWDRLTART